MSSAIQRQSGESPRSAPVLAAAVGWVLLMFCLPPLARMLNRPAPEDIYRLREALTATLPPPEQPPLTVETEPAREVSVEPIPVVLPTPAPPRLDPSPIQPDWSPALPSLQGDFGLAFAIDAWQADIPVFSLAEVDSPPRPLEQPPPMYPPIARQQGLEGRVDFEFVVTSLGRVEDLRVLDARPGALFVAAARAAVERWRFEPARRRGEPVDVRVRVPLEFKLER